MFEVQSRLVFFFDVVRKKNLELPIGMYGTIYS
jgi:hypothetical protein